MHNSIFECPPINAGSPVVILHLHIVVIELAIVLLQQLFVPFMHPSRQH